MPSRVRLRIVVAFAVVGLGACAHSQPMQSSALVPAAEGKVKVSRGDSGNTRLTMEVKHLADPAMVAPGASTYVVWIQEPHAAAQNVGALKVGKNRRGELKTVTPHQTFQVFITAEPTRAARAPTNERLMFANVRP